MAEVEVRLPTLGEDGPDEAVISFFMVEEGDDVKKDADLVELLTDKATFNMPSPADGKVKRILVEENEKIKVGQVLAIIEVA